MGFGVKQIFSESVFMDSGAYSLYNDQVEKRRDHVPRKSKNKRVLAMMGERLDPPKVRRGQGDYSFFDLSKGSPFRKYCDSYASFMKKMKGKGLLFVNVDAIMNPDLTWETQRFFEEEHGVQPTPVIHGLTPMKYLHRYLDTGRYKLIGLGGMGHSVSFSSYMQWADEVFLTICPKSEGYMPQIRVHGFAMTSWKLMRRWPWWSVDSATWVKLAAYGWLYVPPYRKGKWSYDEPPMQINVSSGKEPTEEEIEAMMKAGIVHIRQSNYSPLGKKADKHFDSSKPQTKADVKRWVEHCGLEMEEVRGHFRSRSICNLNYMKNLEESLPEWPHPLDNKVVEEHSVNYRRGFNLI